MYKIENNYTNPKGQTFDGLRTIHVKKATDIPQGKVLIYTDTSSDNYYYSYESRMKKGVMINQSLLDSKKAFRVYKDWAEAWYSLNRDDELVYELQKRQDKIKLTDFPTGIIVVDDFLYDYKKDGVPKVVGQEIPFYENSVSLEQYFSNTKKIDYLKVYLDALKILRELLDNGIFYKDIHVNNFVISKLDGIVKLIDFEPGAVSFDENYDYAMKRELELLKNLIIRLCETGNIKLSKSLKGIETFDELEERLEDEAQKIKH